MFPFSVRIIIMVGHWLRNLKNCITTVQFIHFIYRINNVFIYTAVVYFLTVEITVHIICIYIQSVINSSGSIVPN